MNGVLEKSLGEVPGGEESGGFFHKEMAGLPFPCGLPLMYSFPLEAEESALRKVSLHLVTEEKS